jgi:uncharacterized phiE125 gp8 family phage protein
MLMWNLEKIGAPLYEAVTVAEVKAQARVSISTDDTYIDALRIAAREQVEKDLNTPVAGQAYRLHTESGFVSCLRLPVQPVVSVSSVTYTDENGQSQTLNSSLYRLKAYKDPPLIEFEDGLPSHATDVIVNFTAGYSAANTVPSLIKHAILFLAAAWYEQREAVSEMTGGSVQAIPLGYERIISRCRVTRFR